MPYKDKEKQKQAVKKAVDKRRVLQKGITLEGITEQGITQCPAIVYALADPTKRRKLEKVYYSLRDFKQERNVFYGYPGLGGIPFDEVGELLEATRPK